jgi:hypothetical protein
VSLIFLQSKLYVHFFGNIWTQNLHLFWWEGTWLFMLKCSTTIPFFSVGIWRKDTHRQIKHTTLSLKSLLKHIFETELLIYGEIFSVNIIYCKNTCHVCTSLRIFSGCVNLFFKALCYYGCCCVFCQETMYTIKPFIIMSSLQFSNISYLWLSLVLL